MNRRSFCVFVLLCAASHQAAAGDHPTCDPVFDAGKYRVSSIIQRLVNPHQAWGHTDLVLVVAHRGDWQDYPENSVDAVATAMRKGIELIEIDVRLSQDGVPFLLHDYKLDRTTTGSGYVNDQSVWYLSSLFLRGRYGNETGMLLPSLRDMLDVYYNSLTCEDSATGMRGSVLVIDVKGGNGATTYENLPPVVLEANAPRFNVSPGAGLVFKVKAKDMPADSAQFESALNWSATTRDPGHNLILVMNPDDPTINADPQQDAKFTEYENKPYVLGFELNQSYMGDPLEPYVTYLQSASAPSQLGGASPRTIMMYLQDDFLPEGVAKSDATCCYLANTDPAAATPQNPLDYRGRIELFGGRADLLTVDRLGDVLNYLDATDRRHLTSIQ